MKIGEIWRYKSWLIKLLNDNVRLYAETYAPSTDAVRIRIVDIDGEDIWFIEVNTDKNQHAIKRATFVQIFEKDYGASNEDFEIG